MQQTLFIVILAVVIAFFGAYRWKKKAENKMDNMIHNYKSKQQIYKEILRAMNKCFTKKNNIFVSQEVLSLLEDGWRLTCNYNALCENDFK